MNMKRLSICFLALWGLIPGYSPASSAAGRENAVEFELIVRQKPATIDKFFEITRDTVTAIIGQNLTTFLVNMSINIQAEEADSQFVTFNSHLVTIGKTPYNLAKRYRIEFNLPARLENIPGKNGSSYQLLISPRKMTYIDTSLCRYDPTSRDQFNMDPSGNFDLYYVKGSLGDFRWNNVKNYLEADYTRFRNSLDLTASGKISFFLCPCQAVTIGWDSRFGYAIDPSRSNVYAMYNHNFSSVDAILPNMLEILHLWGYAPPFVVEGLAGYFDFVTYKMKKIKATGTVPNIRDMLTTSGYYKTDPIAAEITASSFIKYLADSYGISKVEEMYEKSDDLTLLTDIETVYNMPLDTLQRGWLHYVDTIQLNRALFDFYASRANSLFDSEQMTEYLEQMTEYDWTRADSIDTWKKLSTVYYQYGQYYKAVDGYKRLIAIDSSRPFYWQVLGNLHMINGEYDAAQKALDTAIARDTTLETVRLQLARILTFESDTAGAIEMAEDALSEVQTTIAKIEFLLFLGDIYNAGGKYHDSAKADRYFSDALAWSSELMAKMPEEPIYKFRSGLAYLGLGKYQEARQLLELADFTELRTYYLGKIRLALGNLHDIRHERQKAVEYYQKALQISLAAHDRELCEKYIERPYKR